MDWKFLAISQKIFKTVAEQLLHGSSTYLWKVAGIQRSGIELGSKQRVMAELGRLQPSK